MRIFHNPFQHLHDPASAIIDGKPFESEDSPARVEAILTALAARGFPDPQPPTDYGLEPILAMHDAAYVHFLQTIFDDSAAFYNGPEPVLPWTLRPASARRFSPALDALPGTYAFGVGTPILAGTWQAAYWSAQCALTAAHALLDDPTPVYALCRPPGHHAGRLLYGGFCFLNNAAIARTVLPGKVAILDIDYHHGNGTQELFYTDPSTFYASLHADPDEDYPFFWGGADERGEGAGLGTNLNLPLPLETEDDAYLTALDKALLAMRSFEPQWLIVSLGFDTAPDDPAGGFNLSLDGIAEVARRIRSLALPALLVQEGGYRLDVLGDYAVRFLSEWPSADLR